MPELDRRSASAGAMPQQQPSGTEGNTPFYEGQLQRLPTLKEINAGMDDMLALMGKINKLYGTYRQMEPLLKWFSESMLAGQAKTLGYKTPISKGRPSKRRHSRRT